jgi:hypothetical protein
MLNMDRLHAALLLATALAAISPPAMGTADRDAQEISRYRLTDAGLAKYAQASRNLGSLAKRMSADCAEGEASDADGDAKTLDESVARLEAIDGVRPAIASAGLTTREYVVFSWSVIQSALAAWALDQPGGKLPAGVSMENVTFYRKHSATLDQLGAQTKAAECDEGAAEPE